MLVLEPFDTNLTEDIERLITWIDTEYINVVWASKKFNFPLEKEQLLNHFINAKAANIAVFKLVDINLETNDKIVVGHAEIDNLIEEIKISRIIIDEKCRGKGFGTSSMKLLIQWIKDNLTGYNRICLTVFTFNEHAIKVYQNVGFELLEIDHGYFQYGEEIWDRAKYILEDN